MVLMHGPSGQKNRSGRALVLCAVLCLGGIVLGPFEAAGQDKPGPFSAIARDIVEGRTPSEDSIKNLQNSLDALRLNAPSGSEPATGGGEIIVDQAAAQPAAAEGEAPGNQEDVDPAKIPSLFFTFWEHAALIEAKNARGLARPASSNEWEQKLPEGEKVKPPPQERDIALGGIVYVSGDDWTIWLNGKRVTPQALPSEVLDLRVYKEYIDVKWLDEYTNQIFPIRLRAHQRFNLDARIFLPG